MNVLHETGEDTLLAIIFPYLHGLKNDVGFGHRISCWMDWIFVFVVIGVPLV